jgi:beta-phosphoglucomutase
VAAQRIADRMPNHFKNYQAFLFDLNGTMIDDMPYHIRAWHRILTGLGADISLEQMKKECYGKNHELLERMFPGRFSDAEKTEMSFAKERKYQEEFRKELKLIRGLDEFLKTAHASGIKTAIGSAAILFNIDFVLDGLDLRNNIDAIVSADDVHESKPHPETFLKCAEAVNVHPGDCLVFEDAPKGVESALNSGMDCLVITTLHQPQEFSTYENVIGFISNFEDPFIRNLIKWKKTA